MASRREFIKIILATNSTVFSTSTQTLDKVPETSTVTYSTGFYKYDYGKKKKLIPQSQHPFAKFINKRKNKKHGNQW